MEKICWLLAAPVLIGAAPPVDAETRKDLRCFIAVSSLVANPDPKIAMSAVIGAQYYLGRIDGRVPTLDLERALVSEAKIFTASDMPQLLQSCGKQMEARGEAVKAIGARMQALDARGTPQS